MTTTEIKQEKVRIESVFVQLVYRVITDLLQKSKLLHDSPKPGLCNCL